MGCAVSYDPYTGLLLHNCDENIDEDGLCAVCDKVVEHTTQKLAEINRKLDWIMQRLQED